MDVDGIIRALGGPKAIADAVRDATGAPYSPNSVFYWKYRGTIPPNVWPQLLDLAAAVGADVTLATLMQHLRPRRARATAKTAPAHDDAPPREEAAA